MLLQFSSLTQKFVGFHTNDKTEDLKSTAPVNIPILVTLLLGMAYSDFVRKKEFTHLCIAQLTTSSTKLVVKQISIGL